MKSLGWTTPRVGRLQRISASTPVGHHAAQVERRLVDEEELVVRERAAQVHLELHAASGRRPACPTRTRRSGSCPPTWPGTSRCRRRAAAPRRRRALARRDADARGHGQLAVLASASANGALQRFAAGARRSARGRRASETSSASTTNSSPPRRPSASVSRTTPSRRAAIARSSSSPAACPSVSLMLLKLSRSMNSAATGVCVAARAAEHLLAAVEDQRAVGQAGERVVGGHERELLLAARELLVGALALLLEHLAHPHERHVERRLRHRQRLRERRRRRSPARAALSRSTSSTASRQRRQRLVTSFSGAARWAASWPKSSRLPGRPPGRPRGRPPAIQLRDRHRRDRADALEALSTGASRSRPAPRVRLDRPSREHIVGARVQRRAEAADSPRSRPFRRGAAVRAVRPSSPPRAAS